MPIIKLKGLPGLNRLSAKERTHFILSNEDKLRQFEDDPDAYDQAAEILYNNQLFKKHFGDEGVALAKANNIGYEQRNAMLMDDVATKAFTTRFSPWNEDGTKRNNHKGLGADYEKYFGRIDPITGQRVGGLSTDGLIKVLESGYQSPDEFEDSWLKQSDALRGIERDSQGNVASINPWLNMGGLNQAMGRAVATGEAAKKSAFDKNNRILEHIYNDEADARAAELGNIVSNAYQEPSIVGSTDEETIALFKKAITSDRTTGNMGIPEYASHYGIVEGDISSEMKDFSIDDMRDVLAKKAVYDKYMSPDMAMTALNNEAKRYIHDHQSLGKKAAMFGKDVLIASTSYTMDKVNGFYNLGLMAADGLMDKPVVWIDTQGNVVDTSKQQLFKDNKGNVFYTDDNGQRVGVHQEQIARTTLHNMGRNMDGSEDTSILNPQDWTRREQFGVWNKDVAKQYEQIGSSPYKVAYNPNDDRDLLYESFKMMSFGLADAGSQLIPFGIGAAGKVLSTANNVGRIVRGLGAATNAASKFLTAETRVGQVAQGTAGALGIAEAYQRGAFQETLAQNMANLEQTVLDRSQREIYDQYHTDENYKKQIDALIDARTKSMKAEYMASLGEEGQRQIIDEERLNEMLRARAQEQVLGEMVQSRVNEHKNSDDYAAMQEEAINGAGLAATNTFWPEAIKYGLVNTIGFRKFLYTTPTSITQKAINNFKGLREITTSTGRKRLATDAYKTMTNAEKWKQFGKVAGSQMWGGAWTNGTDDMMTDAAERINEDSFNRYLHAYENGEALADTYGFADGLWSYWKGFQNSLGQETTGQATLVGALGSTISGNLHFTNIASLATKEGREAFRNNFQQRYKRNDDGTLTKGEDGKPIVEQVGWRENWRDRLGFFIQNGVLNEYYGKKQNLRNLQDHADFVNNILDNLDDFSSIENLVSSNIGRENALNIGDEKTMRFVQAFNAIHALEQLGKDEKDPSTLSSVVMQHKDMIEKASKLGTEESDMTEEEINNLLGQYYSNNPGLAQTEENNQIALQNIAQNARKLQEAYQAYNEAEESIQSIERDMGAPIVPAVRFKMKMSQALDSHWRDRLQTMKDEVGDTSSDVPTEGEALIAAVGGKRKADKQLKDFAIQENVLLQGVSDAVSHQQKMLDAYNQAQQTLRNAEESEDSEAILQAQKDLKEAKDNYDESIEARMFREDMLSSAREKQQRLQDAIDTWEKGTKSKVLTADEIMSLDPVTRAKMMRELEVNPLTGEREADPYGAAQRKQIEKLKARLKAQDKTGDPLQKIQDIALLIQRIAQNEDAYHRISRNPDAAAVQLEKQQKEAAGKAVEEINYRNAVTLASYIDQMDHALVGRKDVSQKQKEDYVYRTLRNKNTNLLDTIEEDNILPSYSSQVQKAKEWAHVTSDIDAVLSNMDRDEIQSTAIRKDIDRVIEPATSREEIIANLERAIDNSADVQRQQDYEELLDGLQKLGYQRDATVIESRKQRKQREEAEAQRKKEAEEDAKIAAAEAQARAQEAANAQQAQAVNADGSNLQNPWEVAPIDQSEDTAEQKGELSEAIDLNEETKESEHIKTIQAAVNEHLKKYRSLAPVTVIDINSDDALKEVAGDELPVEEFRQYLKDSKLPAVYDTNSRKIYIFADNLNAENAEEAIFHESIHRGLHQYYGNNPVEVAEAFWDTESPTNPAATKKHKSRISEAYADKPEDIKEEYLVHVLAHQMVTGTAESILARLEGENLEVINNILKNIGYDITKETKARKEGHTQRDESSSNLGRENQGRGIANLIDNGDSLQGKSATIDEQMNEASEGKEAHSSDENIDYAAQNGTGEHIIETSATSLSGNAMSEWKLEPLKKGVLEHKQGAKPDDSMSKYYAWMEAAGIKLQNIIDQELGQILRQNPHAKIKFMVVRPENNATKDGDMKTHLMLVLDYDNKINKGITHIHNEENGGVIASQGKQYLVIGIAGYGSRNADKQVLYDILFSNNPKSPNGYGLVKRGLGEFWKNNPSERFYVHPTLETEVVPMSLIPGYIVKQLESDSNPEFRSVRELLADPARNPFGLEMNDLGFGIQELTKFMVVGANLDRVMVPRNPDRNSGSAFVLIPAGNGKMVPSYLKPLFYNEMNDGALKDRVIDLLNGLIAPDYATRLQAVENLSRIFHFDKEGNTILLMKSKPVLSLVRDGKPFKTFTLDSNFDRQAFMDAFGEMNPRVNITKSVLQSNVLLQQYDEAGALQTDVAQLATAGSSYSIYGLDAQGKMIQPEIVNNDIPRTSKNSDFKNGDRTQVVFKHQYYNYDVNEGRYYLNGIPVMDETLIRHLDYNRRIIETGLSPIESKGVWSTYILGNKEHPEGVRVHRNTKEIQEIPDAEAVQIIERVEKEQQDKERADAARKAMEPNKAEDVELDMEEQGLVVDDETGEMVTPDELRQRQIERTAQFEEKEKKEGEGEMLAEQPSHQSDKLHKSEAELNNNISATTQNFTNLTKSEVFKPFRKRFRSILQQKWPEVPSKIAELEKFLRSKNVEVDAIGTSETDINVWIDTIENCR